MDKHSNTLKAVIGESSRVKSQSLIEKYGARSILHYGPKTTPEMAARLEFEVESGIIGFFIVDSYSIHPVLDNQLRDLSEMTNIAGNENGASGERNTGNQNIGASYFANFSCLFQCIKLVRCFLIH